MKLPSADATWFVVRARPGSEHLAARELIDGGHEVYLPMRRVRARGSRLRKLRVMRDKHLPLLAGYLFIASPEGRTVDWGRFHDDVHFRHVGRPLCGLCGPLRVPGRIVVQIHVDEMNGLYDETGATKKANHAKLADRFARGRSFRVGEGPFVGFTAIAEAVNAHDRIEALVEIFGRLTSVEFAPEQLGEVA